MPNLNVGFLVVIVAILTSPAAGAADLCQDCMEYASCYAEQFHYGLESDINKARTRCNSRWEEFVISYMGESYDLGQTGWASGQKFKEAVDNGCIDDCLERMESIIAADIYSMCCYTLNLCPDDMSSDKETYYPKFYVDFVPSQKTLVFTRRLKECPNGGIYDKGWLYTLSLDLVEGCYATNFSDNFGDGIYTTPCKYTK